MAADGEPLCRPVDDKDLVDPLRTVDPLGWLGGSIAGWNVLCLAAGGGKHSVLYATAGASVTVVDLSPAMLELDRQQAAQRGLAIRVIEASMDALPMLDDEQFDAVIHPVSSCYLPDVQTVFAEVARVLRPGGLYISQHKQPVSLQASHAPLGGGYQLQHPYYTDQPVPAPPRDNQVTARLREPDAVEYLHRWEQLVGGMCRQGFVIEDLVEPVHAKADSVPGSFAARARFVAPYVRIKARRRHTATTAKTLIL
ncbi:class I SAM-dependent methyltransferase [Roseimaritima sediminicola]|uniref:class I SAM-dependent methyltransferase n=1 Tax=Roseimaritima sediminicola TaxID=2662066 RepID=UPI001298414B|nr:class I SAM-dependent methyltransferase [Roseimaritima sediminicola]